MATLTAAPTTTLSRTVSAPPAQLYQSFTERDWVRDWLCDDAFIRTAPEGHLALFWFPARHAVGQFTALEANNHVAMTLRFSGASDDTHLEVFITENEKSSDVTLTLTGFVNDDLENLWAEALRRLQITLENGSDARVTERVLIGIYPGAFNAEVAQKLNVPVTHGNLVNDVIPGLGAQQAGLKTNDVVVEVDGKAITDETPIFLLVRSKKPGDSVEVVFYREGEKHTTTMPLSGYPMPNFPADFAGLADQIAAFNAQIETELAELFDGISDTEAAHKPAEGEWSANDVLAHLILTERWRQHQIGGFVEGPEPEGWTGNSATRIASVVESYGSTHALIQEFRRSMAETVSVIRHLPASALDRKSNLWWMTFEFGGAPLHTRQHFNQIREAIAAARQ